MTAAADTRVARCIKCRCDNLNAGPGGCTWKVVDRPHGAGICTRCSPIGEAMRDAKSRLRAAIYVGSVRRARRVALGRARRACASHTVDSLGFVHVEAARFDALLNAVDAMLGPVEA